MIINKLMEIFGNSLKIKLGLFSGQCDPKYLQAIQDEKNIYISKTLSFLT